MDRSEELSTQQIRTTKKNSIKDGSAWSVMYGFGEQYVTPFALRLGASNSQIGILNSVPAFLGAISQILGAKLTDNFENRKKIVMFFVFMQAIILMPLFLIPLMTKDITVLIVLFTLYMVFANIIGPSWSSWIGDVVSESERAEYFSKRNRFVVAATMISVLLAGLILEFYEPRDIWIGFGILFSIATIGRFFSLYYLSKQMEPRYHSDPVTSFTIKEFIKKMPHTNFGNFVIFRSLMAFAVMIAGPFFAVFILRELELTYIHYTILILVPMIIKIFAMTYWGRYSNKVGTRNIMIICGLWIATIPIWWVLAAYFFTNMTAFYILIFVEMMTGLAWAGFDLTTFNYVLETVEPRVRARGFAYFNMIFGIAVLLGGLVGSLLVEILPDTFTLTTLMLVFLISAIIRFVVMAMFSSRLKEVKILEQFNEKKLFFELVIARPINSTVHTASMTLSNTRRDVSKLVAQTSNAIEDLTSPIRPYVETFVDVVDQELSRFDKLRSGLEPKIIKRQKKDVYSNLVNEEYNKKLSKHYVLKGKNRSARSKRSRNKK